MNSNIFKKGDILEATHRELTKGYHNIIYFEGHSDIDFCGCMITHADLEINIAMSPTHFETNDKNGVKFKVGYDKTYLVKGIFLKSEEWGPFQKVGELSKDGVAFLNKIVSGISPETFREYYIKYKLLLKNKT